MKIRVERDDGSVLAPRMLDELVVGGGGHSSLARVDGVEALRTQLDSGSAWQPLIE